MTTQAQNGWNWIYRAFVTLAGLFMPLTGWFLKQTWDRISSVEMHVADIRVALAETRGNRFTSSDWVTAKSLMDERANSQDQRITRVEESIPVTKEAILEIKTILREMQSERNKQP
jgi:hypothetical protein